MSFLKDFDYLKIQMKVVVKATNNFDSTKVIGRGGFGKVYRGELSLPQGQITVAFKQLDRRFGQGNIEFWKEVMMLSEYKHENLISLLHFCTKGDDMILVYEYASRGSLDRYLSDANTLTWIQRLKICVGAARGIHFLHDPKETHQRVLHRDIKSANILLDENWMAKVSDFGLSKVGPANKGHSYLVSHGVGTPGYCDPLYMELGCLSKESDVYSFGVVLFEVLCGRLCCEYYNGETKILVPMWRRSYLEKRLDEIILPDLKKQIHPASLKSFSAIAYQCIKRAREERPTMAKIVQELVFSLEQQVIFENSPESSHNFIAGDLEDGPGIESFEIIGDAKPGGKLLACGFPVRGTSLCMFQWIRYFIDGTPKYIEGATNPEYVVTADDVGQLIAVECAPMDDQGREGKIVRLFANGQNKISCDPEMQQEIDKYMSAGEALFSVLLLDPSKSPEQTIFSLTRSKYKIIIKRTQEIFMDEKYSRDLSIKIPPGLTSQFLLARPDGSSQAFTFNDVRTRDTFVLTMRMFQSKALDERRKRKKKHETF